MHAAFITEAELQIIAGVELFLQQVVLTVQRLVFAGVVHWAPPEGALDLAAELIRDKGISAYGPCAGLPALAGALRQKLANENGLPEVSSAKPHNFQSSPGFWSAYLVTTPEAPSLGILEGEKNYLCCPGSDTLTSKSVVQHDVMVTSGANQGFTNLVLTLLDPSDAAILFVPYYFNHLMALQMTGGGHSVVYGRCHQQTWKPDLDWLEQALAVPTPPKMVVLVNPCNPTGHSRI